MSKTENPKEAIHRSKFLLFLFNETVVRVALGCIFVYLELKDPFVRKIHPDEIWLYRNPRMPSYVPLSTLWAIVISIPSLIFILNYIRTRNFNELLCITLAFTLNLALTGIVTDSIKLIVGRPRPDFFWRCFPDGEMHQDMQCTGDLKTIMDGRKSFPSGHSSFAFCSFGFLTLYLIGKLQIFNPVGRGRAWRMMVCFAPVFVATIIALSRTCDYHHHWQDVTIGALIGAVVAFFCYRQYYPPLNSKYCYRAYDMNYLGFEYAKPALKPISSSQSSDNDTKKLLDSEGEGGTKDVKWI